MPRLFVYDLAHGRDGRWLVTVLVMTPDGWYEAHARWVAP